MLVDYKNLLWDLTDQKYVTLAGVIYIVLRAYSILRVAKDIFSRTTNNWLRFFSLVLIWITWPLGLPIYILIRPYWRLYQKIQLSDTTQIICKECDQKNDINNDFCMFCWSGLKVQCKECKTLYPSNYQYCCKCGAPNISVK